MRSNIVIRQSVNGALRYAICAWGGHLTLTQINKFLKRMYRYHYTTVCNDFDNLLYNADRKLFTIMRKSHHCHSLSSPTN